jgi:transcriptional regulator with XRE-family HTH domain
MIRQPITKDDYRRQELAGLLRTRRARISPAEVGLPVMAASRRRTPGLRREDVAHLAGISASLYTWLEQSRDIKTSRRVVDSIARVLKLDATERRLLYELALRGVEYTEAQVRTKIESWMQQFLDSLVEVPAFITDACWDIVAWNIAARAIVTDFEALPPEERNALWLMFMSPHFREDLQDAWEVLAQAVLARFRIDYSLHAGDARFVQLVEKLTASSAEFRAWWPRHDLQAPVTRQTRRVHPHFGEMLLDHAYLQFRHARDLSVTAYHSGEETRQRIRVAVEKFQLGLSAPTPA